MFIFHLFSVVLLTCLIFISTLFSSLFSYSQKIYHLPEITGTYPVGTECRHFIDDSREETFTQKPDDKRELMVQFWYPADIPEGTLSGLVATGIEPIARNMPVYIPSVLRTVYETLYGNAVPDAQPLVQQSKWPVIIFSHGNGSFRSQNAFLLEELASHGYFVAAIDHPYNAATVQFPDGRIVNGLGFGLDDDLHAVADIHAIDVTFLIDQLHILNHNDPKMLLTESLDLTRIGVCGMSLGAFVADRVIANDERVTAGVSLDGVHYSSPFTTNKPYMFVKNSQWGYAIVVKETLLKGGYVLQINSTGHCDFLDFPMVWEIGGIEEPYPVYSVTQNPIRVSRVYTDFVMAYFDKHLKGFTSPLLSRDINFKNPHHDYPEVILKRYGDIESSAVQNFEKF